MNATELKGRLMLAGFATINDWSRDKGFPAATVRKVIERHVVAGVLPGARAGIAFSVLKALSETVGVDVLDNLTAARQALAESARRDIASGLMTDEQMARLASLTQALVDATAATADPVTKGGVRRVLKAKFGSGAWNAILRVDADSAALYLEEWLRSATERTSRP